MPKHYLISDTHFLHEKLVQYGRPKDFSQILFNNLNKLTEGDILIHLGDVCNGKDIEVHEKYIMPLKCKKWLVKGNHDNKTYNWYLSHGWDFVAEQMLLKYFGVNLIFTHIPIPVAALPEWHFNVHGHLHNEIHRGKKPSDRHLLVSSEYLNYSPISLETFLGKSKILKS